MICSGIKAGRFLAGALDCEPATESLTVPRSHDGGPFRAAGRTQTLRKVIKKGPMKDVAATGGVDHPGCPDGGLGKTFTGMGEEKLAAFFPLGDPDNMGPGGREVCEHGVDFGASRGCLSEVMRHDKDVGRLEERTGLGAEAAGSAIEGDWSAAGFGNGDGLGSKSGMAAVHMQNLRSFDDLQVDILLIQLFDGSGLVSDRPGAVRAANENGCVAGGGARRSYHPVQAHAVSTIAFEQQFGRRTVADLVDHTGSCPEGRGRADGCGSGSPAHLGVGQWDVYAIADGKILNQVKPVKSAGSDPQQVDFPISRYLHGYLMPLSEKQCNDKWECHRAACRAGKGSAEEDEYDWGLKKSPRSTI